MARIRTIKPEFWTDEKTGMLTDHAKCLFLGLLNLSDDYGVLEFCPNEWRVRIFPYCSHTTTVGVLTPLLDEILPSGLAIMFSMAEDEDGVRQYMLIQNFSKHQVVNKPSKPLLPGWKKDDKPKTYAERYGHDYEEIGSDDIAPLQDGSHTTTGALPPGKEGKGKEEEESLDPSLRSESKAELRPASKNLKPEKPQPPPIPPDLDRRANGQDPNEPIDVRLYRRGKEVLGKTAGGQITKLKKTRSWEEALAVVEQAAERENPAEWVAGVLRRDRGEQQASDLLIEEPLPPDLEAQRRKVKGLDR